MTPLHIAALERAYIEPPPVGSRKTHCPECRYKRDGSPKRSLSLYPSDGWIDWRCHHCGWKSGDVV
jgi:hypothetical protein